MKKKKAKIICAVLVLLLLLLAGFLYLQRDNLRAIKEGVDSSVAELEECMDENEQKLEDALSGISMRDLTEEEKAALREGTLSREDLEKLLVGEDVGEEEKAYARSLADVGGLIYATYEGGDVDGGEGKDYTDVNDNYWAWYDIQEASTEHEHEREKSFYHEFWDDVWTEKLKS